MSTEAVSYLVSYGYLAVPLWVFAEQMGAPLPSAPILLGAGALAASGDMNLALLTLFATGAALAADVLWYRVGRSHGTRALGRLCRVSLQPDFCVRRAQDFFHRYGFGSLLFVKFIPGLNTVAAPVAGTIRSSWWRFVIFDLLGILTWVATLELLGFAFAGQLERIIFYVYRAGTLLLFLLVIGAFAGYWVRKDLRRRRFLKNLRMDRITPAELKERLDAHQPIAIVDLRHSLDFLPHPYTIPGAIRIPLEDLAERQSADPTPLRR